MKLYIVFSDQKDQQGRDMITVRELGRLAHLEARLASRRDFKFFQVKEAWAYCHELAAKHSLEVEGEAPKETPLLDTVLD